MKGAPERVLQQCTSYYKQGFNVPIGAKDGELFADAVAAMSSRGLRGTVWRGRHVSTVFNAPSFDHPTPQNVFPVMAYHNIQTLSVLTVYYIVVGKSVALKREAKA